MKTLTNFINENKDNIEFSEFYISTGDKEKDKAMEKTVVEHIKAITKEAEKKYYKEDYTVEYDDEDVKVSFDLTEFNPCFIYEVKNGMVVKHEESVAFSAEDTEGLYDKFDCLFIMEFKPYKVGEDPSKYIKKCTYEFTNVKADEAMKYGKSLIEEHPFLYESTDDVIDFMLDMWSGNADSYGDLKDSYDRNYARKYSDDPDRGIYV